MADIKEKKKVLSHDQVEQKIRRIAFEIHENNFKEKELVLAGIHDQGYRLAELIQKQLEKISDAQLTLIKVDLDKHNPSESDIKLEGILTEIKKKPIVLIDDVLNTGKTLVYSLRPFLNISAKKIEIAVLVNRRLKQFPVASNYTGYKLSTTIDDHVEVDLSEKRMGVYLH